MSSRIYDHEWCRFREQFLREPGNQDCAICGRSAWLARDRHGKLLSPHVDHIRRLADGGGKYDRANLRVVCHHCHARKSALEAYGLQVTTATVPGSDLAGIPTDPRHHWR